MRYRSTEHRDVVVEAFCMTRAARMDATTWPAWLTEAWATPRERRNALYPADFPDSDGTDELTLNTGRVLQCIEFGDWIVRFEDGDLVRAMPKSFALKFEEIA